MANTLKHKFVSPKTDGSDSTKLRPSNWNDEHAFSGGSVGSLLYRDTVPSDGVSWLADVAAGSALVSGGVGSPPVWQALGWVDVRSYGAIGDGVANDTAAIAAAQLALPASGGVIYFPPGRYLVSGDGIILTRSNVTFRGAGMYASTITATTWIPMMQVSGAYPITNVAIEDLGFDGVGAANTALAAYRGLRGSLRISRAFFWRLGTSGLYLDGVDTVRVEHSVFASSGDAVGVGISIAGSVKSVDIRGNRFLWLNSGIIIDTGSGTGQTEHVSEFITVEQNYFDLGWWLLTPRVSGSGATVSYTGSVLTDSGAAFSGMAVADTLRVMPVRRTGTGTFGSNTVSDASATFVASGVRRGDIVRTGTVFAVVSNVRSETVLGVEDWLADSDRQSALIPGTGSYTVYGVYLGYITAATATTITVTRFHDFDGADVTPAAQTRYEVLLAHPLYALNVESSTRKIRVLNNTFRRGWADQVSVFGYEAQIIGNTIEDGEDMGITLHGQHNIVHGNTIRHQGAGGVFMSAADSIVSGNVCVDTPWVNNVNTIYLGHVMVVNWIQSGSRNLIANNICDKGSAVNGRHGIVLYWDAGTAVEGNLLADNICRNHSVADIRLIGSGTTNTRLMGNVGTVSTTGGATLWNPLLATGAGATVDQVITALQTLGLVRQI